jgi:hypothetical protein
MTFINSKWSQLKSNPEELETGQYTVAQLCFRVKNPKMEWNELLRLGVTFAITLPVLQNLYICKVLFQLPTFRPPTTDQWSDDCLIQFPIRLGWLRTITISFKPLCSSLSCKKRMILFDTREQKLEIWIKR